MNEWMSKWMNEQLTNEEWKKRELMVEWENE